jgi:hypothetical protein
MGKSVNRCARRAVRALLYLADDGNSATDLSEEIHQFHNGISLEVYNIYVPLSPHMAVARAIAMGILSDESLDPSLCEKLQPLIEGHRDLKSLEEE